MSFNYETAPPRRFFTVRHSFDRSLSDNLGRAYRTFTGHSLARRTALLLPATPKSAGRLTARSSHAASAHASHSRSRPRFPKQAVDSAFESVGFERDQIEGRLSKWKQRGILIIAAQRDFSRAQPLQMRSELNRRTE